MLVGAVVDSLLILMNYMGKFSSNAHNYAEAVTAYTRNAGAASHILPQTKTATCVHTVDGKTTICILYQFSLHSIYTLSKFSSLWMTNETDTTKMECQVACGGLLCCC